MPATSEIFPVQIAAPIPPEGVYIETDIGLTIIVYRSALNPGRYVVELRTEEGDKIQHDSKGCPDLKVMVNEGVIYGGDV
jgi:hypothetical protein